MIRRNIILLGLFCTILSAFVGYFSYDSIRQTEKCIGPPVTMTCAAVLEASPSETARIEFEKYVPGKHVGLIAGSSSRDWRLVCVPLFPSNRNQSDHGYRAVLVCFRGVPNREQLNDLVASGKMDLLYWPGRQELNIQIHSQLAQQYRNLDLVNCPILYYGYPATNPVLGHTSLWISKIIGTASVFVIGITLLVILLFRVTHQAIERRQVAAAEETSLVGNRERLAESTSVLDKVKRMQDRKPSY